MRNCTSSIAALACALILLTGCQSKWQPLLNSEVLPASGEVVTLEKLIIVYDASGSMTLEGKWTEAKHFLRSFVVAMPSGRYEVGATAFGGEWKIDWPGHPMQPFNRGELAVYAQELCPVMGSTFLAEALLDYTWEVAHDPRRTAVLIISDGKAEDPAAALDAIDSLQAAHPGELCVYTVQVGDDEAGGQLLYEMSQRTGCGRSVHAATLSTPTNLEGFVREIFFGERMAVEVISDPGLATQPLLFGSGKAFIRPEYNAVLTDIARMLELNPQVRLRIEGHSDDTGSSAQKQRISVQRAEAVQRALVERGVAAHRLEVVGHSDSRPVEPNTSASRRQLNRRVEIIVLE